MSGQNVFSLAGDVETFTSNVDLIDGTMHVVTALFGPQETSLYLFNAQLFITLLMRSEKRFLDFAHHHFGVVETARGCAGGARRGGHSSNGATHQEVSLAKKKVPC